MMRIIARMFRMAVLSAWALAVPEEPGAQGLVGLWQGVGSFQGVDRERPPESPTFELSIRESLQGEGRVGGVALREWRLVEGSRPLRITSRLEIPLHAEAAKQKVFLILEVKEIRAERLQVAFILRSDPNFDPSPCRGAVTLTRVRSLAERPRPGHRTTAPKPPG